ncbi:MAG: prepilin-type N-terminal cleavage/methylation domain-containing protein [SAR324 cluster bacterium]|uniref:Prepilin-type N-terminal cleavage/methylation domain-containing protein n=1 Tax=SAR324 cluster bacterium TaxID=2024889 RepID=A0A7X9FQE2_9DELT|nr:prepilin-type N-terminal cleavage/methylation domain-containing protein [SAR324 cluster bacterium]
MGEPSFMTSRVRNSFRKVVRRRERGFTLIEIVIAVSILVVIMTTAYATLTQIIRCKKVLDDSRESKTIVNSILLRMTRELQLAKAGVRLLPDREDLNKINNSNLNLIGEAKLLPNKQNGDRITFVAAQGGQYLPDGSAHAGDVQISYRVEENPEEATNEGRSYYLVREELPYITPAKKAYEQAMIFPITDQLVSLSFRYFDGRTNKWVNSWGGTPNTMKLPKLIEFEVKIRSLNGKIEAFKTAVAIRSVGSDK